MKSCSWLNRGDLLVYFSDEQLIQAWKELPDKEQLMLYLIDVEQLSREKVAAIMDVPTTTVKKRAEWARTELKKKLVSCCQMAGMH